MIPHSILHQLDSLRRCEMRLRLIWGLARWLAVVLVLLLVACGADWLIDRYRDTPFSLRLAMVMGQVIIGVAAIVPFLGPLWRRPSDAELALWVEEKHPALQEVLISAVQLNQPHASTAGMSLELIAVVTRQAEEEAARLQFASVVDRRRFFWSALLAVPLLAMVLVPLALWPATSRALLLRQLLSDADIPRTIQIASTTPEVWPSGEKVTLTFQVVGQEDEALAQAEGEVFVYPRGLPRESYPLKPQAGRPQIYSVDMPPSSVDFHYRAYLGDGRMRSPGLLRYEPRPVVTDLEATLLLPAYCGQKPDGSRHEQAQSHGNVAGITGSSARIVIKVQKPIKSAALELLGSQGMEVRRTVPMTVIALQDESGAAKGSEASGIFDLVAGEGTYRVLVKDGHGFANLPPPQRSVSIIAEEPPQVSLLPEYFARSGSAEVTEEDIVEGMPFPPGGDVPIAYAFTGPYGVGQARLLFRVLKKAASGEEERPEEKWQVLPLPEVQATGRTGPFLPRKGTFLHSGVRDQVPFHAMPSPDPLTLLGRTQGGGRYHFKTTGIVNSAGKPLQLKDGDQIEFCVEVVAYRDPAVKLTPELEPPVARSDTRVKTAASFLEFARWLNDARREEDRLRQLDQKQRGLFEVK